MIAKNSVLKIQNPDFNFSFFHRWFFLIVIVATQSVLCSFGIFFTVQQSWLVYNKNVSSGRFSLRQLMEANKWENPVPSAPHRALLKQERVKWHLVQILLWSLKSMIHQNLEHDTIAVLDLVQSWSFLISIFYKRW